MQAILGHRLPAGWEHVEREEWGDWMACIMGWILWLQSGIMIEMFEQVKEKEGCGYRA